MYQASSFTLSHMVCDVSMLHIGYTLAVEQLSVFVNTYIKIKWNDYKIQSSCMYKKQTTDQPLMCNQYVMLKLIKPYVMK